MKKLVEVVKYFDNTDLEKESLVIAYVCAEPETKTEQLYKDIVSVTLSNPRLLLEPKFSQTLEILGKVIPHATSEDWEDISNSDMVRLILAIKRFNHKGVTFNIDDIIKEIVEPERIYKIKKLVEQTEELLKSNLTVIR